MGFNTMTLQEMRDAAEARRASHDAAHDQRDKYDPKCTHCRQRSAVLNDFARQQFHDEWQTHGGE